MNTHFRPLFVIVALAVVLGFVISTQALAAEGHHATLYGWITYDGKLAVGARGPQSSYRVFNRTTIDYTVVGPMTDEVLRHEGERVKVTGTVMQSGGELEINVDSISK